ncbi:MAG: serine/threonine protein kinase [Deltaproteobacteria bacterium]|nr:serine/threonine protein kinase [Deltaproteobacteria bacterium]
MALAAAEQSKIGSTVAGKYRLERVLGRGGMGVVYEAEHLVTNRKVAIKVMHPENQGSEAARRFMNEASAAGRIQHPNVVEVLDAGQDTSDGSLFIVLELLTGIDLATYLLRAGHLSPGETLTVALQVLQALHVAHKAGVVHRDVKPENIFLARQAGGETHVKIVDFGISKAINPEKNIALSVTQSNTTVGTPHYMSPEQAKGEPVDPRADIWALGVVLYECLTGRLPFDGENFNTQIVAVVTEPHAPATEHGVDPELSAIIDKCLQKERTRRFGAASEMTEALQQYLERHSEHGVRTPHLGDVDGLHAERALPGDPTAQLDVGILASDTIQQLPVFPGMIPLDEENQADNLPTTIRAVVRDGSAPLPLSQRPGARSSFPPGVLDPPQVDRSLFDTRMTLTPKRTAALGVLMLLFALGVGVAIALFTWYRRSVTTEDVAQRSVTTLRFVGRRPGARALVDNTPFYSDTAIVRRNTTPVTVRIEAPGFLPLDFTLVPDRDQNVALPPMQAVPPPPAPPPVPLRRPPPPTVTQSPTPTPTPTVSAVVAPRASTDAGVRAPSSAGNGGGRPSPRSSGTGVGYLSVGLAPGAPNMAPCQVYVDGRAFGSTPVIGRALPPGPHRVRCERPGSRPMEQTVRVTSGDTTTTRF